MQSTEALTALTCNYSLFMPLDSALITLQSSDLTYEVQLYNSILHCRSRCFPHRTCTIVTSSRRKLIQAQLTLRKFLQYLTIYNNIA
jgi:hypothetical protein